MDRNQGRGDSKEEIEEVLCDYSVLESMGGAENDLVIEWYCGRFCRILCPLSRVPQEID